MFLRALNIPGSGLTAEQYRLNLIAQNITNAETTRTENGGPYKRKIPVYQEISDVKTFSGYLSQVAGTQANGLNYLNNPAERIVANGAVYVKPNLRGYEINSETYPTSGNFVKNKYSLGDTGTEMNGGVRIVQVVEDPTPGKMVYDPEHPDANEEGYVEMPNVEMVQEMVNMMAASRSYEANVQVLNAMKAMASRALEIGR